MTSHSPEVMQMARASIVSIHVKSAYESCERATFYVDVLSDEGFEMTVASHRTGSIYTNGEGLSIEEARDRALWDAADWGDFLRIEPEPFMVDGDVIGPARTFDRFTTRRMLAERRSLPTVAAEKADA